VVDLVVFLVNNDCLEFDRLNRARGQKSQQSFVAQYANYC